MNHQYCSQGFMVCYVKYYLHMSHSIALLEFNLKYILCGKNGPVLCKLKFLFTYNRCETQDTFYSFSLRYKPPAQQDR